MAENSPTEHVWEILSKHAPQLDRLQHKGETLTAEAPLDAEAVSEQYWRNVGSNLIALANKFDSRQKVSTRILTFFILTVKVVVIATK